MAGFNNDGSYNDIRYNYDVMLDDGIILVNGIILSQLSGLH